MAGKSGLQKTTVPLPSLPPLTLIDGKLGYYTRYRVISDDRNRTSQWSPVYAVTNNFDFRRPIDPLTGLEILRSAIYHNVVTSGGSRIITLSWEPVSAYINNNFIVKALGYDIWVKWYSSGQDGDWTYQQRITQTSLSLTRPTSFNYTNPTTGVTTVHTGTNRLQVEIYARQTTPTRSTGVGDPREQILLYKSGEITVT
jgi:hypothetical protein